MHAYALDLWIAIYYVCGENLRNARHPSCSGVRHLLHVLEKLLTAREETSTTPVLGVLCRNDIFHVGMDPDPRQYLEIARSKILIIQAFDLN
jgi:hypothetical protein